MSKLTRESVIEILSKPPENGYWYNFRDLKLSGLDLSNINFKGADLSGADLHNSNLTGANLTGAVLYSANLSGSNLSNADLTDTDLRFNTNTNSELLGTTISGFLYPIFFHPNSNLISIGCMWYSFDKWMSFTDEEIDKMDVNALEFWKENKSKINELFKKLHPR